MDLFKSNNKSKKYQFLGLMLSEVLSKTFLCLNQANIPSFSNKNNCFNSNKLLKLQLYNSKRKIRKMISEKKQYG